MLQSKLPSNFENGDLKFRLWSKSDLKVLFEFWLSDRESNIYLQWKSGKNPKEARSFLEESLNEIKNRTKFYYMVSDKKLKKKVGVASVKPDGGRMTVGFLVFEKFRRKGYATGILVCLKNIFNKNGSFRELVGICHTENLGARKSMEKIGMKMKIKFEDFELFPNMPTNRKSGFIYLLSK